MSPGGLYDGLDPAVLGRAVEALGFSFVAGSKATIRRLGDDDAVTPPILIAAIAKAHLLGAASIVAAAEPPVDRLLLVTWLIEALGEAMADVALAAEPTAGGVQ